MRILLANFALRNRSGAELHTRDIAIGLHRRGHQVAVYAPELGEVAQEVRAAGIQVTDQVENVAFEPQVIHGQTNTPMVQALEHFTKTPGLFMCHGSTPALAAPPLLPEVKLHVAVDVACLARLYKAGIPQNKCLLLFNFVDTDRFIPRASLPPHPKRVLLYSNYMNEKNFVLRIREWVQKTGMSCDVVGYGVLNPTAQPHTVLPQYDLVIAKGRAALEAIAVGCAVITGDVMGLGEMVNNARFEYLRARNFGLWSLTRPWTEQNVLDELKKYDPVDAALVSNRLRESARLDSYLLKLESIYKRCLKADTLR